MVAKKVFRPRCLIGFCWMRAAFVASLRGCARLPRRVIRLAQFNARTHAGDDAIAETRADMVRLRSAPTSGETGMAVGLFGTAVLVGTPFASLHAMRQPQSGDGGSGGDSGDGAGDGGGCGGGGCGGCGG